MSRLVIVNGVPGVGKDYLIGETRKRLDDGSIYFGSFSDIIFNICKKELGVNSKDMLRELDYEQLYPYIVKSIEYVKTKEPAILSSHSLLKQHDAYIINYKIEEMLKPNAYILVTALPETVLKRRIKDKTRNRGNQNVKEVTFHNNLLLYSVKAFSNAFGSRFMLIENRDDNIIENVGCLYNEILRVRNFDERANIHAGMADRLCNRVQSGSKKFESSSRLQ